MSETRTVKKLATDLWTTGEDGKLLKIPAGESVEVDAALLEDFPNLEEGQKQQNVPSPDDPFDPESATVRDIKAWAKETGVTLPHGASKADLVEFVKADQTVKIDTGEEPPPKE